MSETGGLIRNAPAAPEPVGVIVFGTHDGFDTSGQGALARPAERFEALLDSVRRWGLRESDWVAYSLPVEADGNGFRVIGFAIFSRDAAGRPGFWGFAAGFANPLEMDPEHVSELWQSALTRRDQQSANPRPVRLKKRFVSIPDARGNATFAGGGRVPTLVLDRSLSEPDSTIFQFLVGAEFVGDFQPGQIGFILTPARQAIDFGYAINYGTIAEIARKIDEEIVAEPRALASTVANVQEAVAGVIDDIDAALDAKMRELQNDMDAARERRDERVRGVEAKRDEILAPLQEVRISYESLGPGGHKKLHARSQHARRRAMKQIQQLAAKDLSPAWENSKRAAAAGNGGGGEGTAHWDTRSDRRGKSQPPQPASPSGRGGTRSRRRRSEHRTQAVDVAIAISAFFLLVLVLLGLVLLNETRASAAWSGVSSHPVAGTERASISLSEGESDARYRDDVERPRARRLAGLSSSDGAVSKGGMRVRIEVFEAAAESQPAKGGGPGEEVTDEQSSSFQFGGWANGAAEGVVKSKP